jgi:hypothetical protein
VSSSPLLVIALSLALEPLALDWTAPSTCSDAAQAEERLRQLLPELALPVSGDVEAALRAEVEIVESEAGFRATVRFEGPLGHDERSFADERCAIVSEAALLVIAVSVDPIGAVESLGTVEPWIQRPQTLVEETEAAATEPAATESAERTETIETTEFGPIVSTLAPRIDDDDAPSDMEDPAPRMRPARARVRAGLALLGGGGYGPLTLAQASLGAEVSAFGPWWRATLRGLWLAPRTVVTEGSRAARYDGFLVGALGCGVPRGRPELEFPLCVGVEAGLVRGQGTGTTPNPREGVRPLVVLALGPGLRWAVRERLALFVQLDLIAPLLRGGFTIEDAVVSSIAPVGVRGLGGVELRLP